MFKRGLKITLDDIDPLTYGASVLAAGGGGDPFVGRLLLRQEMKQHGALTMLAPKHVKNGSTIVALGAVGTPTVLLEQFPNLGSLVHAIKAHENHTRTKIHAIVPAEAGGLNATIPLALSLRTGLPVIDADGMGRAFPESQMMTFGIYGGQASPTFMVDDHLNTVLVDAKDDIATEHLVRGTIERMGGMAVATIYPMTGKHFKRTAVRHTITTSLAIGRAVFHARAHNQDPMEALIHHFQTKTKPQRFAHILFSGRIVDFPRNAAGGFDRGSIKLASTDGHDHQCTIAFKNENLLAEVNGRVVAMVPDLITLVDQDRADPITTESLRYGQRVHVIGIAADPLLRTSKALGVVGPRSFGIDQDYVPLEELTPPG